MPISMSDPIHGPIYIGSTGKDVVRIQSRLNEIFAARGETALSADGAFGRRTGQRTHGRHAAPGRGGRLPVCRGAAQDRKSVV